MASGAALYLDTSVALRATLEQGTTPDIEALRTLDALHLATFLMARRRIEGLELLTADQRLQEAADSAS